MDIPALKQELRKQLLEKRGTLSAETISEFAPLMLEQFLKNISLQNLKTVHLFMSSSEKHEPDTTLFRKYFQARNIRLVIPLVIRSEERLLHVLLDDEVVLEKNRWGIEEPVSKMHFVSPAEPDLVLVPTLGFDDKGYRLGYGKGYYDRFLRQLKPGCMKVGLAFSLGFVSGGIPNEEHDEKLNAVVTEKEFLSF